MLLPILKVVTFVATELNLYPLPFVTFQDFPNTLPELVVKSVALLLKTKSVKAPVFPLAVGIVPRLQLCDVFRLGLLPVKILGGAMPMLMVRSCEKLVPAGFSAVSVTVVSPTVVGIPLINPVAVFKLRPVGRLAAV